MYIFELIAKLVKKNKQVGNNPNTNIVDYEESCEHTFFPIDSTAEILACSKCGFIVKSKDIVVKEKNPFL